MTFSQLIIEPLQTGRWLSAVCAVLCLIGAGHWVLCVRSPQMRRRTAVAALLLGAGVWASLQVWTGRTVWAYPLLVAGLAYWVWAAYRRSTVHLSPTTRAACVALRVAVLVVLAAALLGPTRVARRTQWKQNALLVLFDRSRSMGIRDVVFEPATAPAAVDDRGASLSRPSPLSRWQAVVRARDRHLAAWDALLGGFDSVVLGFSTRAEALGDLADAGPDGSRTAIGDALAAGLEAVNPGSPPAAVVLISDGRNNLATRREPVEAAAELAAAGLPLFVVGVGSEQPTGQTRTVLVAPIRVPTRVSAGDRIPVEISLTTFGLAGRPLRVALLVDRQPAAAQTVRPDRPQTQHRLILSHLAEAAGVREVRVRVSTPGLELMAPPPDQVRYVTVADDRIDVLFLAGEPTIEMGFVARALRPYPGIRLHRRILNQADAGTGTLRLPTDRTGWLKYDVIVLHNVPASALTTAQWQDLASVVAEQGKGLMMAGGPNSFGRGGHDLTPLAAALPVSLDRSGVTPAVPVKAGPTPIGLRELVCMIAEDRQASLQAWRELPGLSHVSTMGRPKIAAKIMLTDPNGAPILVGQGFGRGRTMAMAVYSTWEWQMKLDRGQEYLSRFWRQVVLWLANRRPAVVLTTDQQQYDLADFSGGRRVVQVSLSARDTLTGEPLAELTGTISITGPDGSTTRLAPSRGPDGLSATFRPSEPGDYVVSARCRQGDKAVGRAETRFTVSTIDRELANPMPDFALLRRLASGSPGAKGRFFTIEQWSELMRAIDALDRRTPVTQRSPHRITADLRWPLLLLLAGLLILEWIIHRRVGLT